MGGAKLGTQVPTFLTSGDPQRPGTLPSIIFSLYPLRAEWPLTRFAGKTEACTFEEEVGLGQVQLVPEGDTCVLHPCAGLKLHAHLQLEGPGQQSQLPRLEPLPHEPLARHACKYVCSGSGVWTSSPGYWLCGSKLHACPPGPMLLLPTSCLL